MDKKILLIGRNPSVLTNLASALINEGFVVKATSVIEQASQDFNAIDFDVVAFGRGVDAATNTMLKASFLSQNPAILFVDGLAPVISLLVKQIKLAIAGKSVAEKVITSFSYEQTAPLRINVSTRIDCQLTIDLYQLDAIHTTQQKTIVSKFIKAGNHIFPVDAFPDLTSTINFLVAEANNLDLAILQLQ
ncbi:hypothetical protein GO755_11365 [Spirosoma sp. HMF4905]|uniref:Uncharacterized protein n=1 Tax=Spirosoma arboris TaxID=2682092 RepID=A0A7K1SA19_9BACT|nr:hypothetical protein [Spirosoma arboris]MVM30630.1 hypothetical protein [Spirosoma arboris]